MVFVDVRGSAEPEQRALFIPCDVETDLVREALSAQFDRVTVAQNRFHEVGRDEAEAQDAREVGSNYSLFSLFLARGTMPRL